VFGAFGSCTSQALRQASEPRNVHEHGSAFGAQRKLVGTRRQTVQEYARDITVKRPSIKMARQQAPEKATVSDSVSAYP
jgi:hypothetical protein